MILTGSNTDEMLRLLSNTDNLSRFRTSNPQPAFGGTFTSNIPTLTWDTLTATGGTVTHLPNESSVQLSVTTSSGSRAVIQTRRYLRYDPGRPKMSMFTVVLGAGQTNTLKMAGMFDDSDGVFISQNGTTISANLRSSVSGSPVTTPINQSSWNLDKLDGTGNSGKTVDFTKGNIYVIDLAWLGYGLVKFGVLVGRSIIYFHQIDNSGILTSPYMQTASLPVRGEIVNLAGVGSTSSLKITCMSVINEGSDSSNEVVGSASRANSRLSVSSSTTRRPLISIRLKSAFLKASVRCTQSMVTHSNAADYLIETIVGGTLTGSSFSSASDSVEYDIAATALTGGTLLHSAYQSTANGGASLLIPLPERIQLSRSISGTADIITIAISTVGNTSDVGAALGWLEVI